MKVTVFDIETYQELFCFCAHKLDTETKQEVGRVTVASKSDGTLGAADLAEIEAIFNTSDYIVSFNGKKFDLPVLAKIKREIDDYGSTTNQYIYDDAMAIISYDEFNNRRCRRFATVKEWNAKHFDLLNCCLLSKSLKQWEMYNGMRIRELPYAPDASLDEAMKAEIIDYCHYDVTATTELFWKYGFDKSVFGEPTLLAYIALMRLYPSQLPFIFDRVPAMLSAAVIYESMDPIPPKTFDPLALFDMDDFDVPVEIKQIISDLAKNLYTEDQLKKNPELVTFKGVKYGKGGAHYAVKGRHDNLHAFDVASQYPSVIERWQLLKTPLANRNWSKLKNLRFVCKHHGQDQTEVKTLQQLLTDDSFLSARLSEIMLELDGGAFDNQMNNTGKLVLNSLSGTFRMGQGSVVSWDPAVGEAMCFIAQLIISVVAHAAPNWDDVIEVNTDSVFVKGEENVAALRAIAPLVEQSYNCKLEEEVLPIVYFRDVNNYIVYNEDETVQFGKGSAYSDAIKKNSIIAVYKLLFKNLISETLKLDWSTDWREYIYKYHKSAASKYATIGGEPMDHKNYYFMWTTRDCPDAQPISFSRDLIDSKNGSIKARYGVYGFDIDQFEKYAKYIDHTQYLRDLDDELELWGRDDLCTTRLSKEQRKAMRKRSGGNLSNAMKELFY